MATFKLINNVSATSNQTGSSVDVGSLHIKSGNIGIQAVGTGLNASTSTVTLEQSNDEVNWDPVMDAYDVFTITMASGTTSQSRILNYLAMAFVRPKYTKNTNSAGTITVTLNFV